VAVVSHDLKGPLNVIRLGVPGVRKKLGDEGAVSLLDRVDRAERRMTGLITDLLDLAKIEAGRFQVEPSPCDARSLVAEAIAQQASMAEQRRLRVQSEGVEDVCVLADRTRMLQVLTNLLGNAIKFTREGGAVTVATHTVEELTRFAVGDDGPGIAPQALPYVFDRYWQSPTLRGGEGSGLGLYIAKGLVEAHGGRIWVESVLGAGSTFYFTVPSLDESKVRRHGT
jgi:two-component system, chemotaxis family, sensor kinase Cph1